MQGETALIPEAPATAPMVARRLFLRNLRRFKTVLVSKDKVLGLRWAEPL
jgi:hypothetical protein